METLESCTRELQTECCLVHLGNLSVCDEWVELEEIVKNGKAMHADLITTQRHRPLYC